MIDLIHEYEAKRGGLRHVVLMSPGGNDVHGRWVNQEKREVTGSHADAIAVLGAWADYLKDPPASEEGRPAIMDRDHVDPSASLDFILPWKAFTRGYHYGLYDHPFEDPPADGPPWELVRRNIGATVSYSRRFADLAAAKPRGDLSSTGYCLTAPGRDYLVFQPGPGKGFRVRLETGPYRCEWFRPETAKVEKRESVRADGGDREFVPPFDGPAVLFLSLAPSGDREGR
jgi:hypothetical protein